MRRWRIAAALALTAALPLPAQAGIFDDEDARRQITELEKRTGERFDTLAKAQLELARQIEGLNAEIAKLRGQLEVVTHDLDTAQKRQRDFYVDLDSRLRALEKAAADAAAAAAAAPPPPVVPAKPKVDPLVEARDFENALALFKLARYKEALPAFDAFQKTYPESALAPSAQFWIGNTHYALRDCKKTIEAQNQVVEKWPASAKVPDAMLAIATCQQELGTTLAARKTLEFIIARYGDAPAADTARQRLKKK